VRIRRLAADDIDLLRAVRLDALRTDPDAFGSTLEREEGRSDEDWMWWVSRCATFVAEDDQGAVGLAGGIPDDARPDVAVLISMWVAPTSRGRGVGRALVEAVVGWATGERKAWLTLHVVEGNGPALALYEKCGFALTGERVTRERDGATELVMTRASVTTRTA
jgi:GNAT superfamily N-acetyltransferase